MSKRIIIKDSTLREGLQVPGVKVALSDKIKILRLLDKARIPEVEIGIPEGIRASSGVADYAYKNRLSLKTSALVPAYIANWKQQVDNALKHHFHKIDITMPVSDILLGDYSLYRIKKGELLIRLKECIRYAKSRKIEVGAGLIDATRADVKFLSYLCRKISGLKVKRIIIYDTAGVSLPQQMHKLISCLRESSSVPLFVHCHNDYGMAVANTVAAVIAGAEGAEVAVNGIGGRSGNAALEEVVLALEKLCRIKTGVKLSLMQLISDSVEKITRIKRSPIKPITGKFSFTHTPVMHIRCVAGGRPAAFEPFFPELVGNKRKYAFSLPLDYNKAIEPFIKKLGVRLCDDKKKQILRAIKQKSFSCGLTEKEIVNIIKKLK